MKLRKRNERNVTLYKVKQKMSSMSYNEEVKNRRVKKTDRCMQGKQLLVVKVKKKQNGQSL